MAQLKGETRARYVATMFGRISRRYDRLNTVMTGGRHYAWRRKAAKMAVGTLSGDALDVATGTGDFALDLIRRPQVTGVVGLDFTWEMLPLAVEKTKKRGHAARINYLAGDAHNLPFVDDRFICLTVGFGVRNFIDVPKALLEMTRVIRPGGRVVILEIVRKEGIFGKLFSIYFRKVTPWMGALFAGEREAYTYLPESVQGFMSARELADLMRNAGLQNVRIKKLAMGTVAILAGEKAAVGRGQ
ncbi:MAG: bifunctional demethylmenaquinone methyltransferase/2-methoxy-6-polyprenyl-1,4-benzoquinol methylase UbiE [SAR202 cluster bacterium]|nr:bifunctional demethylmenaquinone methyltransferase/2-methoxy-6-polyprenyl-1,4-benzoquinol methylase UbiE [SAR202 cluster bacterium]